MIIILPKYWTTWERIGHKLPSKSILGPRYDSGRSRDSFGPGFRINCSLQRFVTLQKAKLHAKVNQALTLLYYIVYIYTLIWIYIKKCIYIYIYTYIYHYISCLYSIYLIYLLSYLSSIYLIYPSIHPPIHPSTCLSIYLSVCLSIYLIIWFYNGSRIIHGIVRSVFQGGYCKMARVPPQMAKNLDKLR